MAERTKRGQEDRKREAEKMRGEPLGTNRGGLAVPQAVDTTRDKGVAPADDTRRDEEEEQESR